jgi:hypothetical protein
VGSLYSQVETVRSSDVRVILFPHLFTSDHHQLSIILDILGTPSLDDFYAITSQRSREYLRALPFRKKKPFSQLFPEANPKVRKSLEAGSGVPTDSRTYNSRQLTSLRDVSLLVPRSE